MMYHDRLHRKETFEEKQERKHNKALADKMKKHKATCLKNRKKRKNSKK